MIYDLLSCVLLSDAIDWACPLVMRCDACDAMRYDAMRYGTIRVERKQNSN